MTKISITHARNGFVRAARLAGVAVSLDMVRAAEDDLFDAMADDDEIAALGVCPMDRGDAVVWTRRYVAAASRVGAEVFRAA